MKRYSDLDRHKSLLRLCPDVFDMECLYIGARNDRADFLQDFHQVMILEVFTENVRHMLTLGYKVLHMDVRDLTFQNMYDVVFWWHGPEHVRKKELPGILRNLEKAARKLVVLGCPWGKFEQGEIYGNPYERHLSHHTYRTFEKLGYTVECLGRKDKKGSNITAVKYV